MLGGADNPNGELPSYITGADSHGIYQQVMAMFRVSLAVLVIVLLVLVYGRNTVLQQQIAYGLVQQSTFRDASLGDQLVEQRYKVIVERGREAAAVFQEGFGHNGKVPLKNGTSVKD